MVALFILTAFKEEVGKETSFSEMLPKEEPRNRPEMAHLPSMDNHQLPNQITLLAVIFQENSWSPGPHSHPRH